MAVAILAMATEALPQTPTASTKTPPASTITLDPITVDNNINAAEAEETITVTGKVSGANAKVGDVVTLTLDDGKGPTTYSGQVVELGNGMLGFSINVPGSALFADADHVIVTSLTRGFNNVIASANTNFGANPTLGMDGAVGGGASGTTVGSGSGGGGKASPS